MLLCCWLAGPAVLVAVSGLLASFEARAERREVVAVGLEHAPELRNFLLRQSMHLRDAPHDHETALRRSKLHLRL